MMRVGRKGTLRSTFQSRTSTGPRPLTYKMSVNFTQALAETYPHHSRETWRALPAETRREMITAMKDKPKLRQPNGWDTNPDRRTVT